MPRTREGVNVTSDGRERPDVPSGSSKDNARARRPVIAYACLYYALVEVARAHGYALAMHGSMTADLDIVALPWVEDARDEEDLIAALAEAAGGSLYRDKYPGRRPHEYRKHVIHLGGGPYLDLCVVPRRPVPVVP